MTEHPKTQHDAERIFIEKLISCGYPKDCIIHVQNDRELPGDIVIKNGKRYVQAFEIKNNVSPQAIHYYSQYVGTQKVNLPIYMVTYNNGGFEFYDSCSLRPLDESEVLSYEQATDAFVQEAKKVIKGRNHCWLKMICTILAVVFFMVGFIYLRNSFREPLFSCGTVAFAILTLVTSIIPFSDKLNVSIGDLGLGVTFSKNR